MIYGILLAAGRSLRFGTDKLLHTLPDDVPLGVASARCLLPAVARVVAVVRPDAERLQRLLSVQGIIVTPCPVAEQGMGASLAWGVRQTPWADGWLVALADMPFIRPATVKRISEALNQGALLAAPVYRGRRGHPVGFSKTLGAELCSLSGEVGAKTLINAYGRHLVRVATDDSGVLRDIDTPDDLLPH